MSIFLILLAAGDSKRLKSNTPKPYCKVNNRTILEHSLSKFKDFKEITKTIIVYNKKHKKYINKLKLSEAIKMEGSKVVVENNKIYFKLISEPNFSLLLSLNIL